MTPAPDPMAVPDDARTHSAGRAGPPPDESCASCGSPRVGRFCSRCGQRHGYGRLSMRTVASRTVAAAFDLDRGLLHTALRLCTRPGEVAADYVDGRTVRYTNPTKYFVIAVTLAQLLALWLGMTADFAEGLFEATETARVESADAADAMNRHFVLLNAAALPIAALGSRICFRRSGHNYAEHMVFNMYIMAQMIVVTLVAMVLLQPLPASVEYGGGIALLLGSFAYYSWAARDFFGMGIGASMVRTAGTVLILSLLYFLPLTFLLIHLAGVLD